MSNDIDIFLAAVADALKDGHSNARVPDPNHPSCPFCNAAMNNHIGDGYWDCPRCGFSFSRYELFLSRSIPPMWLKSCENRDS